MSTQYTPQPYGQQTNGQQPHNLQPYSQQPYNPPAQASRKAHPAWRVVAWALTAIGALVALGTLTPLIIQSGQPGGANFDFVIRALLIAAPIVGILLLAAFIIFLVIRSRSWWAPVVALAVGIALMLVPSTGLPQQVAWPLIRADLEADLDACPERVVNGLYEITRCWDQFGGRSYALDNHFLSDTYLLWMPNGKTPQLDDNMHIKQELGDDWYFIEVDYNWD